MRDFDRTSTRVPPSARSRNRTTTSSLKRNQRSWQSLRDGRRHVVADEAPPRASDDVACDLVDARACDGRVERPQVRPGGSLLRGDRLAVVLGRVPCPTAMRQHVDEQRRILRVGGDVVNGRHGPSGAGPARRTADATIAPPGCRPAASQVRRVSIRRDRREVKPGLRRRASPAMRSFLWDATDVYTLDFQPVAVRLARAEQDATGRSSTRADIALPCLRAGLVPVDRHERGGVCPAHGAADRRSVARRGRAAAEHRHQPRPGRARLPLDSHAQGPRALRWGAVRTRHACRRHGPRQPAPDCRPARWRWRAVGQHLRIRRAARRRRYASRGTAPPRACRTTSSGTCIGIASAACGWRPRAGRASSTASGGKRRPCLPTWPRTA